MLVTLNALGFNQGEDVYIYEFIIADTCILLLRCAYGHFVQSIVHIGQSQDLPDCV